MIEEMGLVKRISGNTAWIETAIKTTCNSCQAKSNCGTSVIAKVFNPKPELLALYSPIELTPGQYVKLGIPEEKLVTASALVYLLPLGIFMFSIIVLQASMPNLHELLILLMSTIPTLIGFWWVSRFAKTRHKGQFSPVILGAVNTADVVAKHEIPIQKSY